MLLELLEALAGLIVYGVLAIFALAVLGTLLAIGAHWLLT